MSDCSGYRDLERKDHLVTPKNLEGGKVAILLKESFSSSFLWVLRFPNLEPEKCVFHGVSKIHR